MEKAFLFKINSIVRSVNIVEINSQCFSDMAIKLNYSIQVLCTLYGKKREMEGCLLLACQCHTNF